MSEIDIYDENMQYIGKEDKKIAHEKGLFHKVFTGLVFNSKTEMVYLQTIHPKEAYTFERPDYVDFSVGGHVEAGEDIVTTAVRETEEEMGLKITEKDLFQVGIRKIEVDPSETYHIREFQFFYKIAFDGNLSHFDTELMDGEVKSIIEVKLEDFMELINMEKTEIPAVERKLAELYYDNITLTTERVIPDYLKEPVLVYFLNSILNEK